MRFQMIAGAATAWLLRHWHQEAQLRQARDRRAFVDTFTRYTAPRSDALASRVYGV